MKSRSYIDLGHFAALLANNTSSTLVKEAATQLVSSLQDAVIAERHGSGKKGSTGLAVYFPNSTLHSSPLTGPQCSFHNPTARPLKKPRTP